MTDHIKMPDVAPVVRYAANGAQTVFAYPFPIFAPEDMAVYLDGARQHSRFHVSGAGDTAGGQVTFDKAPKEGATVTLMRRMPIERMSDFIEGGEFSAAAINGELDYLTAALQQVQRDQSVFLRYGDHEAPGRVAMPDRAARANKALGFDGDGNPVAVSLAGSMAAPDVTMGGAGAVTRTAQDKFADMVSVKDFGAKGDGLSDDTPAFQKALGAHDDVFVPPGEYLVSGTITLGYRQTLRGAGQSSVIRCNGNDFTAIEIVGPYNRLADLRIEGGGTGIKLYGRDAVCVQNNVTDVGIFLADTGVQLDGYTDPHRPCYWNNFDRVLVAQMARHGFHLMRSGAGDTPNANKFHACRAYSLGTDSTGAGFYVEAGAFNNAFIDCEANVAGTAAACFRLGAQAAQTLLVNPFAESLNLVPNVKLEAGSTDTSIMNLMAASDGAAIEDFSGGSYTAYNAGWPFKNRLQKSSATDFTATLQRYGHKYWDPPAGEIALDASHSVNLISSYSGPLTVRLPRASEMDGAMMVVKKIDISSNVITVVEDGGPGADGRNYYLGMENDYVQVFSNSAEWFVISSNRAPGNIRYYDGAGLYEIDMAVDTYILSSYSGALTARLPPANAPEAVGRTITLKKTDPSANPVTITELGGAGPDNGTQTLSGQYDAVTIVSNGAQWYVLSTY